MLQRRTILGGAYEHLGVIDDRPGADTLPVRHLALDTLRSIKVARHQDGDTERLVRLQREGRLLARLRHPHIVQVHDLITEGDTTVLVLEHVEGHTLAESLEVQATVPLRDALEIVRQTADALRCLHVLEGGPHGGLVHRNVNPNAIRLRRGSDIDVVLTDFGLVQSSNAGREPASGHVRCGPLPYLAPEELGLCRDDAKIPVDCRADIFALGLVLHELVEGRRAWGVDFTDIARRRVDADIDLAFTISLPESLRELVRHMTRRFPEERPARMEVVLAMLERAARDVASEGPLR